MNRKHIFLSENFEECVQKSIEQLRNGGLICVPTETVYGIICDANQPKAIQSLSLLKRRDQNKPFALFTDSLNRVEKAGALVPRITYKLAEMYWPGPLTMVLPAKSECPCEHNGSVGVRCPDHEFLQSLIIHFDGLLVNTSLNISSEPPVWEVDTNSILVKQLDLVIDGGKLKPSSPSTVIDCREETIRILREGAIPGNEIEEKIQKK